MGPKEISDSRTRQNLFPEVPEKPVPVPNQAENPLTSVLVVDNDVVIRQFLTDFFHGAGLQVETAADGLEALHKLEGFSPDLILMDLVMPHIDGRMLCRMIRGKKQFSRTPIVVISGIASEESENLAELNANICIAKSGFSDLEIMMSRILHDPGMLSDLGLKNQVLGVADLVPRNITRELLAVNRFSATILDSISNGIVVVNVDGRVLYANPAALRIFSAPLERMLGSLFSEWFPDDSLYVDVSARQFPQTFTARVGDRILQTCAVSPESDTDIRVIILEDITKQEEARIALEDMNRILERHARIDFLTNTFNRRHFSELLDLEWGRMRRVVKSLAVLVCDVDYFKDYNDSYGHVKGDQCLQAVAAGVRSALRRPSDCVARYGGDEFVIILPDTALAGAVVVAQQILEKINAVSIAHGSSPTADHVTISIGVAHSIPGVTCSSAEKLLILADKALYQAKRNGRNCFVAKEAEK